jgi:hypothetical protein
MSVRLRGVGIFATRRLAEQYLRKYRDLFPTATIEEVYHEDRPRSSANARPDPLQDRIRR